MITYKQLLESAQRVFKLSKIPKEQQQDIGDALNHNDPVAVLKKYIAAHRSAYHEKHKVAKFKPEPILQQYISQHKAEYNAAHGLTEASYAGNLGTMEMTMFHMDNSVPKRDKERQLQLMQNGYHQRAIHMVRDYIRTRFDKPDFEFHPSIYPTKKKPTD